jgi:hypothetical protein
MSQTLANTLLTEADRLELLQALYAKESRPALSLADFRASAPLYAANLGPFVAQLEDRINAQGDAK